MTSKLYHTTSKDSQEDQKLRVDATNWKADQVGYVYWVRLPEMTEIETQGYVGITDNLERREKEHRKELIKSKFLSPEEAENTIFECVFVGTMFAANKKEGELRPRMGIGWNFTAGGGWFHGMSSVGRNTWPKWVVKMKNGKS